MIEVVASGPTRVVESYLNREGLTLICPRCQSEQYLWRVSEGTARAALNYHLRVCTPVWELPRVGDGVHSVSACT